MATRMILIRHGDPGYLRTFVGKTDYELVPGAKAKAKKRGKELSGEGIRVLYSSKLKRAMHTADAIGKALGLKVKDRFAELNEVNFGEWENMTFEEVGKRFPKKVFNREHHIWNFNGYEGESYAQARDRALPRIFKLLEKHEGETFAIVIHGALMQILRSALTGEKLNKIRKESLSFLTSYFFKKDGDKITFEKKLEGID